MASAKHKRPGWWGVSLCSWTEGFVHFRYIGGQAVFTLCFVLLGGYSAEGIELAGSFKKFKAGSRMDCSGVKRGNRE